MNLGQFRLLTAGLPDDYEIVVSPGDATWAETNLDARDVLAPVAGAPGVIALYEGQEITEEYLLPIRMDLDEAVELEYHRVPDDWEIQWADGTWVKATAGVGAHPDDVVIARPGPAYWASRERGER